MYDPHTDWGVFPFAALLRNEDIPDLAHQEIPAEGTE